MKITHRRDYAEARRAEYPPIGDQLDALWKALSTTDLPPAAAAMLAEVLAVKERFPKPPPD